jgi:hypothetical protein
MSPANGIGGVKRIIVLGGFGFFGGMIVRRLRAEGFAPLLGSRRSQADVVLDIHDPDSIRAVLRNGDIVVDAVGPYQDRGPTLVQAAIDVGFDVIDLADSLRYVQQVYRLQDEINASACHIFTACSTVSAISAASLQLSGLRRPRRISGFLVPSTKYTAVNGTAVSLLRSIGQPVEVYHDASLQTRIGWRSARSFHMPKPIGRVKGRLFESADAVTLPPRWPTLETVDYYVSTNVNGLNQIFTLASYSRWMRQFLNRYHQYGLSLSRFLGHPYGGVGYEVVDENDEAVAITYTSNDHGYIIPIAPAILAVRKLAAGNLPFRGLIPGDQQLDPDELIEFLENHGVTYRRVSTC